MSVKYRVWAALLVAASGILFGLVSYVAAENVTVTIGVGDTVLAVSGKTSPQAFVTIKNDDTVIGTTTAANDGTYTKTFSAQTPGVHKISVSAHTPGGMTTDTVSLQISIIEHAMTAVELFLPPTVAIEDASLSENQLLKLKGETTPLSTVKLFLDDAEYVTTTSDANGEWIMSVDSDSFSNGQHQFFLRSVDGGGAQSYPTVSRSFSYSKQVNESTQPEATQPSSGSSSEPLSPPSITYPVSGTSWDKPEITVKGTAPPGVQIELWDGTRLLGSAWSNENGDWSLKLFLESHEYNLRARACMNNLCSDFSAVTLFNYSSIYESLYVRVPKTTFSIVVGQSITLEAEAVYGEAPYETKINWGDDVVDSRRMSNEKMTFSHIYDKPGKYTVYLEMQDGRKQQGGAQYAIYVRSASSAVMPLHTVLAIVVALCITTPLVVQLLRLYRVRHTAP